MPAEATSPPAKRPGRRRVRPALLSLAQVAELLGVGLSTAERLKAAGRIGPRPVSLAGPNYRYREADVRRLNRWLNETGRVRAGCRELATAGLRVAATPDGKVAALAPLRAGLSAVAARLAADAYTVPDLNQRAFRLVEFATYGRLTRPACVAPPPAECETLAGTDVTLSWSDYRQPFPRVIVALPDGFPPAGPDLPRPGAVLSWHDPASRIAALVVVGDGSPADRALVSTFVLPDPGDTAAAGADNDQPERYADELLEVETATVKAAVRIAMNAALLLAVDGHRSLGPSNPGYAARLRASLGKRKLPPAARPANERALAELPEVYDFLRPPAHPRLDAVPDPTGREVSAHWRRGHWTRQPCGDGQRERKLLHRPPVLVRADRLAGEVARAG